MSKPDPAPETVRGLALLRMPFPPNQISKLPKPTKAQTQAVKDNFKAGIRCQICGSWHHPDVVHLDYVGHAALTDRLLDADPSWSWEPAALVDGLPAFDRSGGLWIKLTVCGVTRLGYGHADTKPGADPGAREKEVIGDALRNAAMRFGAALDLWHKGDLHVSDEAEEPKAPATAEEPVKPGPFNPKPPATPTLAERANRLTATLEAAKTQDDLRRTFDRASGLCADLDAKDPERLVELTALYERLFLALDGIPAGAVAA
jgi:hypothetical protein